MSTAVQISRILVAFDAHPGITRTRVRPGPVDVRSPDVHGLCSVAMVFSHCWVGSSARLCLPATTSFEFLIRKPPCNYWINVNYESWLGLRHRYRHRRARVELSLSLSLSLPLPPPSLSSSFSTSRALSPFLPLFSFILSPMTILVSLARPHFADLPRFIRCLDLSSSCIVSSLSSFFSSALGSPFPSPRLSGGWG